jgi:predicted TIM-barrel fold metal-dependent hydrolase
MRIDTHSHIMEEKHLSGQFLEDMQRFLNEAGADYSVAAPPPGHMETVFKEGVEKATVFGLQASASGIIVPNDYIANYVAEFPDKLVGYCSIDPLDPNARREVERSYHELSLKGLKLGPIYQHVHPHDKRFYSVYQRCNELGMPLIFHQGSTTPRDAPLSVSSPLFIEDIAIEFPDMIIQIAHMGHPWYTETIQVLRKQRNVVADISSLWPRPWQFYNAMILAQEYGVTDQIVYGTDYPFGTPEDTLNGLMGLNKMVEGTNLPRVRDDVIESILDKNAERIYGFLWG